MRIVRSQVLEVGDICTFWIYLRHEEPHLEQRKAAYERLSVSHPLIEVYLFYGNGFGYDWEKKP
jgi:hypothetical protein